MRKHCSLVLLLFAGLNALRAPNLFNITFETTVQSPEGSLIILEVNRSAAPIGVDHLYTLMNLPSVGSYYTNNGFFRVMPGFVVQFGINGEPAISAKYNSPIQDDPVRLSNTKGTFTYAATSEPNSRTTQLFINYADNSFLDSEGFAPLGRVVQGMSVAEKIYSGYAQTPDQNAIYSQGNSYLRQNFPKLDYIKKATL